jgi:hypothetical protein
VISVGLGINPAPEFLVNALKRPWTLSTSQARSGRTEAQRRSALAHSPSEC